MPPQENQQPPRTWLMACPAGKTRALTRETMEWALRLARKRPGDVTRIYASVGPDRLEVQLPNGHRIVVASE